ncbi:MAG: DUF5723 family protein [Bacteroidales bacterium]|nr:DUF5723 family protein [Bacteroidales bacterium]
MRIIILFFIINLIIIPVKAQEMLGIINSNYAGTNGISFNPSSMVASKLYMDFSLFACNAFAENNYHYIHSDDYGLFKFITGGPYPEYGKFDAFTDIYKNEDDKNGCYSIRINGPAGMLVYGKHAYGITTAFRTVGAFRNLPYDIANFLYETIDYKPQFGIEYIHDEEINLGHLSWFELGLSYAYNFHRYKWEYWSLGITLKPLFGYAGLYINSYDVDYLVYNDSIADIFNADFEYAYSLPIDYNNNDYPDGNGLIKGFGIGTDLGITYQKTTKGHSNKFFDRLCAQRYEEYRYKIGFSITDLGYIKFTKKAEKHVFKNVNTYWEKWNDTLPDSTLNTIKVKLNHYFSSNLNESLKDNKFNFFLPPAINIQFDYSIYDYLFLNSILIYGINIGDSYLKRPTIISVAPRFETSRLEISLPLSLYEWDWRHPRIGLTCRFGNFIIGTDKLGSLFSFSDFTGYDIYFALKLNLSNTFNMNYIKGNCGNQRFYNIETFDYRNF